MPHLISKISHNFEFLSLRSFSIATPLGYRYSLTFFTQQFALCWTKLTFLNILIHLLSLPCPTEPPHSPLLTFLPSLPLILSYSHCFFNALHLSIEPVTISNGLRIINHSVLLSGIVVAVPISQMPPTIVEAELSVSIVLAAAATAPATTATAAYCHLYLNDKNTCSYSDVRAITLGICLTVMVVLVALECV